VENEISTSLLHTCPHPLWGANEVGENKWQLVYTILHDGNGLIVLKCCPQGYDGTHYCCICSELQRTNKMVAFKV
jgi:hypothetical protein